MGPIRLCRSAATHRAENGEDPSGTFRFSVGVPNTAPANAVCRTQRRSPASTSKDTDFERELAPFGLARVPPLTLPKTAKIRAALPAFPSASQTPPRLTRFALLVNRLDNGALACCCDVDLLPRGSSFGAPVPSL
ncbi:hypothetical protein MRX96_020691 [Rhipicephalus microplus]